MSQINAPEDHQFNRPEQTQTMTQLRVATELNVAAEKRAIFPANPLVSLDKVQAVSQQALLLQELEKTRQALQHQQHLVESLREQLANSQARTAQLECDLALVQQRYRQQAHLLQETETACLDLRTRLHRQQRQTLQFKAALEQCLDATSPNQSVRHDRAAVPERSPASFSQGRDGSVGSAGETQPQDTPGSTALTYQSSEIRSLSTLQYSDEKDLAIAKKPELEPSQAVQPLRLPLVFKEQPIQPWSASALRRRPVIDTQTTEATTSPSSTPVRPGYQTVETTQPDRATHSSTTSKKKTLATVELPSFPRYRR